MAEKEMRNFALRDEKGNEISVFTGKAPRQAALQAAGSDRAQVGGQRQGSGAADCQGDPGGGLPTPSPARWRR